MVPTCFMSMCCHPTILLLSHWLIRECGVDAVDTMLPACRPCDISNEFVVLSFKLLFGFYAGICFEDALMRSTKKMLGRSPDV